MHLSSAIVDLTLFHEKDPADMQIWAFLTRSLCTVFDMQVNFKAHGPLVFQSLTSSFEPRNEVSFPCRPSDRLSIGLSVYFPYFHILKIQPNLAQSILGCRELKILQLHKDHSILKKEIMGSFLLYGLIYDQSFTQVCLLIWTGFLRWAMWPICLL